MINTIIVDKHCYSFAESVIRICRIYYLITTTAGGNLITTGLHRVYREWICATVFGPGPAEIAIRGAEGKTKNHSYIYNNMGHIHIHTCVFVCVRNTPALWLMYALLDRPATIASEWSDLNSSTNGQCARERENISLAGILLQRWQERRILYRSIEKKKKKGKKRKKKG
jgi:hypothetical protein